MNTGTSRTTGRHVKVQPRLPSWSWVAITVFLALVLALAVYSPWIFGNAEEGSTRPRVNELENGVVTSVLTTTDVEVTTSDNERLVVRIIGTERVPQCGTVSALEFADRTLRNQQVTLVPDRSVEQIDAGGEYAYHVVLRSQLSFSDAAIATGNALASSQPTWYRDVYQREEREAQNRKDGVWGPPCVPSPPNDAVTSAALNKKTR